IPKDDKGFDSIPLEDFLNYLQAERFIEEKRGEDTKKHNDLIEEIQKKLFLLCNTQYTEIPKEYEKDEELGGNRYYYHEKLAKKLLQRPVNLRRVNLFTTNYDLSFEYAFDNAGIHSINGFSGFQRRCFCPETYDYDIYYPGQTTSGKVNRAEKVIRYYKLHGSLSWIYKEPDAGNLYGIEEVVIDNDKPENELVIYPCATKKAFTLDLPYSELFRLFSCAIKQSQAVLFCLGYSFNDEHINNIIYQALSIPSFTLFVIDYKSTENSEIKKLRTLDDPRIIVIEGEFAKFTKFVSEILPDLYEEKDDIKIAKTIKELIGTVNNANPDENSKPEDSDV
ncbi:SIR2 family protein, partial [bacterium]|nr:SIR2 family protein [bacterium]